MNTQILPADSQSGIARALETLQAGELVAFPTDTVYGLGALAFDGNAILSLYIAKNRPVEKAIPVLIGDRTDLNQVADNIPEMARRLSLRFWPGPLTLVVPKKPGLPEAISSTNTVGIRMPDHPGALALLRAAGPLAVTSANLSGSDSPTTAEEVFAQLGARIALILDGGKTPGGIPSCVVDCTGLEPVLLREGPLSFDEVQRAAAK